MKIWMEENTTSTNNKSYSLVDITSILDEKRCRIRKEDNSVSDFHIGYHEKGPIIDSTYNRAVIHSIRMSQAIINDEIKRIQKTELDLERISLKEISNDPNF